MIGPSPMLVAVKNSEKGTNDEEGLTDSEVRQNPKGSTGALPNKFIYTGSAKAQGLSPWQIAFHNDHVQWFHADQRKSTSMSSLCHLNLVMRTSHNDVMFDPSKPPHCMFVPRQVKAPAAPGMVHLDESPFRMRVFVHLVRLAAQMGLKILVKVGLITLPWLSISILQAYQTLITMCNSYHAPVGP